MPHNNTPCHAKRCAALCCAALCCAAWCRTVPCHAVLSCAAPSRAVSTLRRAAPLCAAPRCLARASLHCIVLSCAVLLCAVLHSLCWLKGFSNAKYIRTRRIAAAEKAQTNVQLRRCLSPLPAVEGLARAPGCESSHVNPSSGVYDAEN